MLYEPGKSEEYTFERRYQICVSSNMEKDIVVYVQDQSNSISVASKFPFMKANLEHLEVLQAK